jgi:spore maturation protein CgeB
MAESNRAADQAYEREKRRRRRAEAQVELLKSQLEYYKAELKQREQEVRYQLGDALVRAANPSLDTLKLPFRLVRLFWVGLKRRRARRLESVPAAVGPELRQGTDPAGPALVTDETAGPQFDNLRLVAHPFSRSPVGLRRRSDLRVAAVTDEFSWWAWQFEADVYTFTPQTWRRMLEKRLPDLLLMESTWRGPGESWHYQVRELGKYPDRVWSYVIPDLVAWCRQRGVPTVFYNKEDPPNFGFFIDAARRFDFVFTSDANCIDDYRRHLGHDRVFALPFGAQPRIHNPVWAGPRDRSVCFAGTWYDSRHHQRQEAAPAVLQPALEFDLHIYDRMAGRADRHYQWPELYRPALRGELSYAQMLTAYKRYKVFLNINSVANSPTMFSRRVFELLACGTPVVSSYSEGIEELLGADLVLMSTDQATTRRHLERLLGDDQYRERLSLRGQRKVFAEHTCTHRLQAMLDTIGLERPRLAPPVMTMLVTVEDSSQLAAAWQDFGRQTYANKRLVLCATRPEALTGVDQVTSRSERVEIIVAEGAAWGQLLGQAVRGCPPGFVVAVSPAHYYGPEYLTDYAHATLYVTEPAIGKASFYQAENGANLRVVSAGLEYRVASRVNPWTLCLPTERLSQLATVIADAATPEAWWEAVQARLGSVYSADRFNYVEAIGGGGGPRLPEDAGRLAAALV